jgi:hypothetical protein
VVAEVVVVVNKVGEGSLKHRGRLVNDQLDLSFKGAVGALDPVFSTAFEPPRSKSPQSL